jgi:hypothetical protein
VDFSIRRSGHTVIHGTAIIKHGGLVLRGIRRLRRGRYTLIVATKHGRVLARRSFVVR